MIYFFLQYSVTFFVFFDTPLVDMKVFWMTSQGMMRDDFPSATF